MLQNKAKGSTLHISIIIPIHNGSSWIDACFTAITKQTALKKLEFEVCVCNDSSSDETTNILNDWKEKLWNCCGVRLKIFTNESGLPCGVGFAKNRAVSISSGGYLCFQDVDDVMLPDRLLFQYGKALELPQNTIVGSKFFRVPEGSTARYTKWANNLTQEQLKLQVYTSHGPTIIMPSWFCHRSVYDQVGGFSEEGKGTPEDLIFFYKHLDLGGELYKINEHLLSYYYHPHATTFSIHASTIWKIRMERIQRVVLSNWEVFTIWNAGKQGRKFYNSLSRENQAKVVALCDVDVKKIGKKYTPFDATTRKEGRTVDIVNYRDAVRPFVICVKMDLTEGQFEENLKSLGLKEGCDYVLFS